MSENESKNPADVAAELIRKRAAEQGYELVEDFDAQVAEWRDYFNQPFPAQIDEDKRRRCAGVIDTSIALNIVLSAQDRLRRSPIQDPEYSDTLKLLIGAEDAAEKAMDEAARRYRAQPIEPPE
jgi:hypothetical protein